MGADIVGYLYALAVAGGGLMGYVKKGSLMSGIMGVTFGGLAAFGAYQTSKDPNNFYLALGTSAILGSFMGYRAFNSGKFMPAGLVAVLSLAMVARFGYRYLTAPAATNNKFN